MKKYWILDPPSYGESNDSVARFYYHNGWTHVLYQIPGILCPICEVAYEEKTYPFKCPERLRSIPAIQKHSPLPLPEFKSLMEIVELAFEEENLIFSPELMNEQYWMSPGLEFLDRTFEICCHPPYSFHWGNIKDCPIVKQEVKDVFELNQVSGVSFHQVEIKYVGKALAKLPPADTYDKIYVPGWWTAPEYFHPAPIHIEPEENPESFGPLYYMCVPQYGADWRDWKTIPRCHTCGQYKRVPHPKTLSFQKFFLIDYDIFKTNVVPASHIVISEKVRNLIEQHGFTNYSLKEFNEKAINKLNQ
jgi:hypothetical protein